MPTSLADGHTKFTLLPTAPANPAAPTVAELAAGIDASCNILSSDFTFGAADSDKVQEKPLCVPNNVNALGPSNYTAGVTPFRYFDDQGASDPDEDDVFQLLKKKGTVAWAYARRTSKLSTDDWAAGDEIFLGAKVLTDEPQPPSDLGGYIKWRVPMEVQSAWPNVTVAAGTP